jgi:hypothetical protein
MGPDKQSYVINQVSCEIYFLSKNTVILHTRSQNPVAAYPVLMLMDSLTLCMRGTENIYNKLM